MNPMTRTCHLLHGWERIVQCVRITRRCYLPLPQDVTGWVYICMLHGHYLQCFYTHKGQRGNGGGILKCMGRLLELYDCLPPSFSPQRKRLGEMRKGERVAVAGCWRHGVGWIWCWVGPTTPPTAKRRRRLCAAWRAAARRHVRGPPLLFARNPTLTCIYWKQWGMVGIDDYWYSMRQGTLNTKYSILLLSFSFSFSISIYKCISWQRDEQLQSSELDRELLN